jgi:hypothetical protein
MKISRIPMSFVLHLTISKMGVFYETIPEKTIQWCLEQKMFCVASAPLTGKGHVNVSPKGAEPGQFGIPDDTHFWYLDFTGKLDVGFKESSFALGVVSASLGVEA